MSKAVLITGGNLGSVAENLEAAREAGGYFAFDLSAQGNKPAH